MPVPARMVNNDGRGAWSVSERVAMTLHQQIRHIGSIQTYNSQNKIKYITCSAHEAIIVRIHITQ